MNVPHNYKSRNKFDLSHKHLTTTDLGYLIPASMIPTMPGDDFNLKVNGFFRGMPTFQPIMDRIDIKTNLFYVPYRLLWRKFEKFISRSQDFKIYGENKYTIPSLWLGTNTIPYDLVKELNKRYNGNSDTLKELEDYYSINSSYPFGKLIDYIGLNVDKEKKDYLGGSFNMFPLLAYHTVFIEYYAPQRWVTYLTEKGEVHDLMRLKRMLNLLRERDNPSLYFDNFSEIHLKDRSIDEIKDLLELFRLRKVYWNPDYFSNALPEPTIFGDSKIDVVDKSLPREQQNFQTSAGAIIEFGLSGRYNSSDKVEFNNKVLNNIRGLRQSIALQHFLEMIDVTGGRYLETMEVMYNETIPTELANLPTYVGGDVAPFIVGEVESTTENDNVSLGDVGGKPLGSMEGSSHFLHCNEFGLILVLNHLVPKRSYNSTCLRQFVKYSFEDFPNVIFEGVGDQPIYNYELGVYEFDSVGGFEVFGYVPRYSEWKTMHDRYSGEMSRTMVDWHLGDVIDKEEIVKGIRPEFFEANVREDIFRIPSEPGKIKANFDIELSVIRNLSYNNPLGYGRV